MNKQDHIGRCRLLIEQKFNRGSYLQWTNGDYEKLSDSIVEEVKQHISTSSLKRIFGKVNYSSEPHISTLDILAKYIGYKDWYDFVNQKSDSGLEKQSESGTKGAEFLSSPPEIKVSKNSGRLKIGAISLAVVVILAGLFFFLLKNSNDLDYTITFHTAKPTAPSNVIFEYDISKLSSKVVTIDFNDHFSRDQKENIKTLSQEGNTITHTYRVSGVYHPIISVDKKPVDTLTVCVYSDGWEHIFAKYTANSKEFYFISPVSVVKKNGIMTVPASEAYKYLKDTVSDYWIKYRYLKNFNVEPKELNFTVKARSVSAFKNNCNEIDIWVLGEENNLVFKVFDPGCVGDFSKVQLGRKILDGNYNDLSAFGHSLDEWREISLNVKDKKATISIDGKVIYENMVEGDLGPLTGFVLHTKGAAEFDYVGLEADGKVLMRDDF